MKIILIASALLISTALPSVACGNGNFMIDPSGRCIDLSNMQPASPSRRVTPTRPVPQQNNYTPRLDEQPRTPPKDPKVEKIKKEILNQPGHRIVPTPNDLRNL